MKLSAWSAAMVLGVFAASSAYAFEDGDRKGIWTLSCGTGLCQAFMTIEAEGKDILSWTITANPERNLVSMLLSAPVGTALPPGIRFWTAAETYFDVPFQVCDPNACTAVAVVDAKMRQAIAGTKAVRVSYYVYGKADPIVFDAAVEGFPDAVAALEAHK